MRSQAFKGSLPLSTDTAVMPHKPGTFTVISKRLSREVVLNTERDKVADGMAWIVTLQQAINSIGGVKTGAAKCRKKAPRPVSILSSAPSSRPSSMLDGAEVVEGSARYRLQMTRAFQANHDGQEEELDGEKIDNARWAAIRKGMERMYNDYDDDDDGVGNGDNGEGFDSGMAVAAEAAAAGTGVNNNGDGTVGEGDGGDDEDVRFMQEMEEEEERRQEEERQEFLASRQRVSTPNTNTNPKLKTRVVHSLTHVPDDIDRVRAPRCSIDINVRSILVCVSTQAGRPSSIFVDNDDCETEDEESWMIDADAQEAEEEKRQEEERRAFLAEKAAASSGAGERGNATTSTGSARSDTFSGAAVQMLSL